MSELKRLTLMWGDKDRAPKMGDLPVESMIEHLRWAIQMLENPPKPYMVMEWVHETAEFKFTGSDIDPFSPEAQQTCGMWLADKPYD